VKVTGWLVDEVDYFHTLPPFIPRALIRVR